MAEDSDELVHEDWLESEFAFAESGLKGMTKLLPPFGGEDAAIAELCIAPESPDGDGWLVSIVQGMPGEPEAGDDHVLITSLPTTLTRRHVRDLLRGLGISK